MATSSDRTRTQHALYITTSTADCTHTASMTTHRRPWPLCSLLTGIGTPAHHPYHPRRCPERLRISTGVIRHSDAQPQLTHFDRETVTVTAVPCMSARADPTVLRGTRRHGHDRGPAALPAQQEVAVSVCMERCRHGLTVGSSHRGSRESR